MSQPIIRKEPLGLTAGNAETAAPEEVTARMHIERTDICPIKGCGKQMQPILVAKDIPSYICWDHRCVLPQPNPVV